MSSAHLSKELVIFLHGYAATPAQYKGLIDFFEKNDRAVFAPNFESQPFTSTEPDKLVDYIVRSADAFVREHPEKPIVLCGHSMGCVFLRAAVLKWAADADSLIGAAIRGNREGETKVRMLLLASTNRGFRPQGEPALGLEIAHRWYWLFLLLVAGCWLIRDIPNPLIQVVSAGLTAALLGVVGFKAFRQGAGSLACLACMAAVFAWLAFAFVDSLYLNIAAIALTGIGSFLACRLLAYTCPATLTLTILATLLASLSLLQPAMIWIWPAMVLLAWPAMVWPWHTGLLLEHVLFGSGWLTSMRLKWLDVFARAVGPVPSIPTVHLFGDRDRLVEDGDHEELAVFVGGHSGELRLTNAHHKDFMLTARPGYEDKDRARHPAIREALQRYLTGNVMSVVEEGSRASRWQHTTGAYGLAKSVGQETRSTRKHTGQPEHVVFLIHGIRDFGEWQDSLAAKVRSVAEECKQDLKEVIIIRYGYFNAFQFLLWGERERASRLFLDAYAQARSRFPNAKFSVAAHSNGTFVVANSLLRSGAMRLEHVYFAGSVLWTGFFGNRSPGLGHYHANFLPAGTFSKLRSDCASQDWPVGALCWWLSLGNRFRWGMLGTGGVDGFKMPLSPLQEVQWINGGHGEGLKQRRHEDIAKYLFTGETDAQRDVAQPDHAYLRKMRLVALIGVLGIAALYGVTILIAPVSVPAWGVIVGSLLTIVVVRIAMAI